MRPLRSLALSVAFALLVVWLGLGVAYFSPYPVGFWITHVRLRPVPARGGRTAAREGLTVFAHEFVRNAYLAGTFVALACGIVGWLVVLRAQVFAGDALSHVAFVGAVGAAVLGLDVRVGLFVLTIAVALGMASLGRRGEADDTVIGIVFAWILGIGILLITLLATSSHGGNGLAATNALFGSIYSLSASASWLAALIGAGGQRRDPGRVQAAAAGDARRRAGGGARPPGPGARGGVPGRARGGDRREHRGGRRAAAARVARRARREPPTG